jgi:hypothetical protein
LADIVLHKKLLIKKGLFDSGKAEAVDFDAMTWYSLLCFFSRERLARISVNIRVSLERMANSSIICNRSHLRA